MNKNLLKIAGVLCILLAMAILAAALTAAGVRVDLRAKCASAQVYLDGETWVVQGYNCLVETGDTAPISRPGPGLALPTKTQAEEHDNSYPEPSEWLPYP